MFVRRPSQGGFDQIRVSPRTAPLSGRAKIPHSIQITQFEGCQSSVGYSQRPNQNGTAREDDEAGQKNNLRSAAAFQAAAPETEEAVSWATVGRVGDRRMSSPGKTMLRTQHPVLWHIAILVSAEERCLQEGD